MKNLSWRKFLWGASLHRDFDEIKDLVIRYIKEETVKPLKDLGRFVMWGTPRQSVRWFRRRCLAHRRAALSPVAVSRP